MTDGRRRLGGEELKGIGELEGEFARLKAPYRNAEISLIDKPSNEVPLMEIRIREGRRITIVELDAATVGDFAKALQGWADKQNKGS